MAKSSKSAEFPKVITRDSLAVKIYRANNDGVPEYHLVYRQDGKRKQIVSRDLASLEARAEEVLDDLSTARPADANALTAQDREQFALLCAISAEVHASPVVAVRHYAEAVKILGSDLVIEAARAYRARNMHKASELTVKEVCDQMIEAKAARGRSSRYVQDLRSRLGRFSDTCKNVKLGSVTQATIQRFLDDLKLSPRTHNNYRACLIGFFAFAKRRKYLPSDWDEMAAIETMEDGNGEITIYEPEEIEAMLAVAGAKPEYAKLIPFLALGAFAGLRSAEIARLHWSAINFQTGYITLNGKIKGDDGKVTRLTKTGTRRIVPISANLRAWLQPLTKPEGQVWPFGYTYQYELLEKVCAEAKIKWRPNALRHSYISYRVAQSQDVNRIALEAGNSPAMIFQHYRELVRPDQAEAWFAVMPHAHATDERLAA